MIFFNTFPFTITNTNQIIHHNFTHTWINKKTERKSNKKSENWRSDLAADDDRKDVAPPTELPSSLAADESHEIPQRLTDQK